LGSAYFPLRACVRVMAGYSLSSLFSYIRSFLEWFFSFGKGQGPPQLPPPLKSVVVSAPGKVLVCGGYLVLEQPNIGVVLSLGSRFYAKVETAKQEDTTDDRIVFKVISPQFKSTLLYAYDPTKPYGSSIEQISMEGKNPYVECTLRVALPIIQHAIGMEGMKAACEGRVVEVTIRGDNDFYSQQDTLKQQGLELSTSALASLPPFGPPTKHADGGIAKTGLGSSAALVTSLVGGLLTYFDMIKLEKGAVLTAEQARQVHNVAQACHCYAQGKIGSGFDVSSAVYGSQRYIRFSPTYLKGNLPEGDGSCDKTGSEVSSAILGKWDNSVSPFSMPSYLHVVLGDVCGGSNTPSMVSKVLKWKKEGGQEALDLWNELGNANLSTFELLSSLAQQQSGYEEDALSLASEVFEHAEEKELSGSGMKKDLLDLAQRFSKSRRLLRDVGIAADVPIEPQEQCALLDYSMKVPGVVAAGVPGAGGYDAIFAICIGDDAVKRLKQAWSEWEHNTVCALPCLSRDCGLCEDSSAYAEKAEKASTF